jgi:hypothetical protein
MGHGRITTRYVVEEISLPNSKKLNYGDITIIAAIQERPLPIFRILNNYDTMRTAAISTIKSSVR